MSACKKCGKEITLTDEALYRKLMDMKATEFMCIDCLALYFGCTTEFLNKKIDHFKQMGCFLFENCEE